MTRPHSEDVDYVNAQDLLQGFHLSEWPDLSATRETFDEFHFTKHQFPHPQAGAFHRTTSVLTAIAYVLGTYCGVSDILLAVQFVDKNCPAFVRIAWNDTDTWGGIERKLDSYLQQNRNPENTLAAIQRVLDLSDKQLPSMVLCRFTRGPSEIPSAYPLTFVYDISDSVLSLTGSKTHLHRSISSQIVSQLSFLVRHAEAYPESRVSSAFGLPSALVSRFERTEDIKALSVAYPHILPTRFASDYLTERNLSVPNSIAVQWYPSLSPENAANDDCVSITYADLHKKANQVARWLRSIGLQNEERVAVCMNRDLFFHIAMLGIMRSGGCYVPIDPDLPPERKSYIAKDSDARFVFTSTSVSSPSLFGPLTVFFDEPESQEAVQKEREELYDLADPDGLAFLLYTSGTTGTPKGCLLTHRGLSQAVLALSSTAADVGMDDITRGRYLAVASIAFDVHIAETFVPLALGMPLISAQRSQLLENLPFYVKKLGITHLGIVPSLIEATMGAVQESAGGINMALRYIASGGEKMSDLILDKWASHPQVRLANFYGPSEATIGCCARYMDKTTPRANIGRPFANVSGYVVDSNLNIVIRGGIGELIVEGPLVGRGYHKRPDLTEMVFLEWPQKGKWSYRTGDLVRMMPDSTLEILGRIDTQIKLRGVRIESEGISSTIRKATPTSSSFSLDAATVLAKHPSIGTEQLVSFIAWDTSVPVAIRKLDAPSTITPPRGLMESIRYICETELPRYMRPSHIVPLGWLPLSSNGKSDNKRLVGVFNSLSIDALADLMTGGEKEGIRPPTDMEKAVVAVLKRHTALPLGFPHPYINIFECGLDSMSVIRFTTDLHAAFDKRVSVADIMSTPTLEAISSLVENAPFSLAARPPHSRVGTFSSKWLREVQSSYPMVSIDAILPAFSVQEGVLSRSAEHETLYVQHIVASCKEGISIDRLHRAWERVVAKHSILRTVFHFSKALIQVVLPPSTDPSWDEKETALPDGYRFTRWFLDNEAVKVAKTINQNLSTVPPFRLCIYVSSGLSFFVFSIHHSLFDGISLPMLMDDVGREYIGSIPQPSAHPSEILDHIAAIDLDKARSFWLNYFQGYAWPSRPLRRPITIHSRNRVVHFEASLSSVKKLATSQQVTLQALLTGAFARLISARIYKSSDVSFGVLRSGRLIPVQYIEGATYPLVCVLPMRVNLDTPKNVLQKIQQDISAMVEVEHVPLGKVQNWVRPGRPLFDVLFSVSVKTNNSSEIWKTIETEPPEADYILSVEVVLDPRNDTLLVQVAWIEGGLDENLVVDLVNQFEDVVHMVTGSNAQSPGQQSIYSKLGSAFEDDTPVQVEEEPKDLDPLMVVGLRGVISKFLGVDERLITETTSFISLGLDSISSVGLSRMLQKLDYKVSPLNLMTYSTLQKLANHLTLDVTAVEISDVNRTLIHTRNEIQGALSVNLLKLSSGDHVDLYPTTALQAGMLSQTISSEGSLYVHAFPLKLMNGVDTTRLRNAWGQVVDSLSILRTSFHFITELGIWVQGVHTSNTSEWTQDSFDSEADYTTRLSRYLASIQLSREECFHRPPIWFRLFNPVFQRPEQVPRLVLVMHHALYDGLSIGKLFETVKSAYCDSYRSPPVQFTDLLPHVLHQERLGASFFARNLQDYRPVYLLRHTDRREIIAAHTAFQDVILDPHRVNAVLHNAEVTLQCIGQAVWAKMMYLLGGSLDVVFGHVVSGRSIPGAEDVIGPVLNTVPCRIRLQDGMRNIELLKYIHQLNLDALPWQQASLRSIQQALGVTRLWDSLFLFQPLASDQGESNPLWEFDDSDEQPQIQYAINIEIHQQSHGLTIKVASHHDFMTVKELEDLVRHFVQLLKDTVADPSGLALVDLPKLEFAKRINSSTIKGFTDESSEETWLPDHAIRTLLSSITSVGAHKITSATPLVALGIDSITAIQVVSRFRQAGMRISVNDIVTSQSIGDMIGKICLQEPTRDNVQRKAAHYVDVPAEERAAILLRFEENSQSIENVLTASAGMKWLIGSWQKSNRSQFQHAFAYRLPNHADVTKLRGAWVLLLRRLVLLRSTLATGKGFFEPRIVTFKHGCYPETWDEQEVKDDEFTQAVTRTMKELVSSPPPINVPQARAVLVYSSQQKCLIIHLHHFQFDAWSLPLIIDDLSRLYLGFEPVTSNDLALFLQASRPNSENLELQRRYWQASFPPRFQPVLFPTLMSISNDPMHDQARTIYTSKTAITSAALCEERARSLRVSLQAVFLACWARVQGRYSSAGFSTLGLWQAGRSGLTDDIAKLAAPCSNIVPMYISGLHDREAIDLAKDVQDDLRARSAVVVQSDLAHVNDWVGAGGKPLCNVVVNIVRIAPDVTRPDGHLEQVEMPYFIPRITSAVSETTINHLSVTDLIQNDLIIDIAPVADSDSILMSIDAAAYIMDEDKAKEIVNQWAQTVKEALKLS